jgi:hypothetical protein
VDRADDRGDAAKVRSGPRRGGRGRGRGSTKARMGSRMDGDENSTVTALQDSHAQPIEQTLLELLDGLSSVCRKADQEFANLEKERRDNPQGLEARKADIRRKAAMASLDWIMCFLCHPSLIRRYPQLLQSEVSRHLFDLMSALNNVMAGVPDELFEPPKAERQHLRPMKNFAR